MTELCANLPSEGLLVEEFITDDSHKTVWVIHVPKHMKRRPVYAHSKAWQRLRKLRKDGKISNTTIAGNKSTWALVKG